MKPPALSCTLAPEHAMAATSVAMLQILRKVHNGGRDSDHGRDSGRSLRIRIADTIMGLMCEIAATHMLNLAWMPGGREITRNQEIGGFIEARGTEHEEGHLILYEDDTPHNIYALVINAYPQFSLVGFLVGQDGMDRGKYWNASANNPSFWIPQGDLLALEDAIARLSALRSDLADMPLRLLSATKRR